MSCSVKGTTISLTRGDSCTIQVGITDDNGDAYTPKDGDTIRFAVKKTVADTNPLILKTIPLDTMILKLEPNDTKPLEFRTYVYDIELTTSEGDTYTFITKSSLIITEEVH